MSTTERQLTWIEIVLYLLILNSATNEWLKAAASALLIVQSLLLMIDGLLRFACWLEKKYGRRHLRNS